MTTETETNEQTEHWTDRPLVRPLWARILVGAVVAVAGLVGAFYLYRNLADGLWRKDTGPLPDTPATAPFPSGEFPEWGGMEGPFEWVLHMLVWCGLCMFITMVIWAVIMLLIEPLSDFGDPLSKEWAPLLVVVAPIAVLVVGVLAQWVLPRQHQDEWLDYQDQAVERFTGWAQERYGLDLSGMDDEVVLDLMGGVEEPVLLADGRMLGTYESRGELILTHDGQTEELDVVAGNTLSDDQ